MPTVPAPAAMPDDASRPVPATQMLDRMSWGVGILNPVSLHPGAGPPWAPRFWCWA
ncbi:hypothetical protein [Mesobaculum littorinae]|uniref:hypothetical protein n=1 Tax=Mesobaculum littorinae TaxID=2486419 RepID=UPI001F411F37|nr:hypothetical protein [Mesobaculum littorinae]